MTLFRWFYHLWHSRVKECQLYLQLLLDICNHLGVPIANKKVEGPSTCLVFLGILIDTMRGELRLPLDKLTRLRDRVKEWLQKKRCTKRELLSLAGQLQHAATVIRPGRTFLRRLFDLSATVQKPNHHLSLNKGARSDLAWWHDFLMDWNGVSLLGGTGANSLVDIRRIWEVGLRCILELMLVSVGVE